MSALMANTHLIRQFWYFTYFCFVLFICVNTGRLVRLGISPHHSFWLFWLISSLCSLIGMMSITQWEKPVTMGFCQANKNGNVTAVRVDTDQSSPSVSGCLALSVSLLTETLIWWFERKTLFLPLLKQSRAWYYVSEIPACMWKTSTQNAVKHLCMAYFYFMVFFSDFFLLLYFWCNNVQIHLAESFINLNEVTECRSEWASSYYI